MLSVPPARDGVATSSPADGADVVAVDWMRGVHGALVQLDGIPPSVLREVAMVRRSSGIGVLDRLAHLPGDPVTRREPPRTSAARPAAPGARAHPPVALGPLVQEMPPTAGAFPDGAFPDGVPTAGAVVGTAGAAPRVPVTVATAGGAGAPDRAAPAVTAAPGVVPVPAGASGEEGSLADFLDRRLTEARFLLLPNRSRSYAISKRAADLVLGSVLLVLAAPVMFALAVLIRLDSPGPAIFSQERVTRGGRVFRFHKFRTMYVDARDRFPHLYDYDMGRSTFESAFYKLADDPRNTRIGRWLRRTTLDELPNLINVVKGDLSLVGPRPDLPEFVRLYRPEELCCLFTKAGLTGMAQVAGRSLLTVRERLTLDMRYVAQQTLLLDLRILWRTVIVVLSGRGAF